MMYLVLANFVVSTIAGGKRRIKMDFKYLFTSFDGRIARREFWLGILVLIIASFALIFVLGIVLGFLFPMTLLSVIGTLIILYPAMALNIKRLHDRNKGANPWAFIFFGPGILVQFMQITGIGFTAIDVGGVMASYPSNGLVTFLTIVVGIIGLWALVELGFLKGTDGDNNFGPDPLEARPLKAESLKE